MLFRSYCGDFTGFINDCLSFTVALTQMRQTYYIASRCVWFVYVVHTGFACSSPDYDCDLFTLVGSEFSG